MICHSLRLALVLVATASLLSCGAPETVQTDLVQALGRAETFTETPFIDVGESLARSFLLEGWLPGNEYWAGRREESFVWTVGPAAATFRFFVFEKRDLVMTIRGRPNPADDAPLVELGVEVNGTLLARPEILPGWNTYRVTVPRQVAVVGENVVRLVVGGDDGERRLAVERVDFERTLVSYPPRREMGAPALVMPYLSGAWYRLEVAPGQRLSIAELVAFGPHGDEPVGHLEVLVTGGPDSIREQLLPGDSLSLALPPGQVRVGLVSVPGGDPNARVERQQNEEAVGLIVRRPAIVGSS